MVKLLDDLSRIATRLEENILRKIKKARTVCVCVCVCVRVRVLVVFISSFLLVLLSRIRSSLSLRLL